MKKGLTGLLCAVLSAGAVHAQTAEPATQPGTLSGDLMMNVNFFNRDTAINAANNPLYDNYLSGGEAWLSFRYNWNGFTAFARIDALHNSNLFNPTQALSTYGIGAYSLSKDIGDLTVTGGYIYDQIGSGVLFRAYEDRGLLIDNALVGLQVKYRPTSNINIKAFTGQQKQITPDVTYNRYKPVIKGFNAEGDFDLGKKKGVHISPGVGVINRTLDETSMGAVVSAINAQTLDTRFVPKYNMYAFSAYNTLTAGNFSWFVEGAYKTHEAIVKDGGLRDESGTVVYSTLGYARKGLALNFSGKRTENFEMRTSPNEILLRGMLNWQPIVARLRPNRLMARYTPPSQNLSELALSANALITPSDNLGFNLSYTYINTLTDIKLYREIYADMEWRSEEKVIVDAGVQVLEYNQELYQVKPGVPLFKAITPFTEITYRISEKRSLRAQLEYMATDQDFGSWAYALLEYNIAPHWSFAISDMYLTKVNPEGPLDDNRHFYQFFTGYTTGPHRFTAAFVRQVEGINCTGGVCRYEPAFSGFKVGLTTSF